MATGSGKSLLYQFPVLYVRHQLAQRGRSTNGSGPTVVVVSPLVSLMQNQTRQLQSNGISSAYIGGDSPIGVERDAQKGKYAGMFGVAVFELPTARDLNNTN